MFEKIKKTIDFLQYRVFTKKSWRWPAQSDVLIYDACGEEYLLNYLSPWKPVVLHVRGELMNMPVALVSLFRGGKKSHAYVDSFIDRVKPKIIVTFIDNNPNFYLLSNRHPNIKTLFIQNGWRGYYADIFEILQNLDQSQLEHMKVDYMMTFGSVSGDFYAKYITGKVVPMGSIKSNYLENKQKNEKDLIVFISQWCKGGLVMDKKSYTHSEFFRQADQPILKWLRKYSQENNKKLMIAPRFFEDLSLRSLEETYYKEILEDGVEFLELDGTYPAYQAIDMADVVVTIDSTLGYESVARGNKTAFFSIRSSLLSIDGFTYGWPEEFSDEGLFWTNILNVDKFTDILNYLFTVEDSQWESDILDSGFTEVMINDPENKIFKKTIRNALGQMSATTFNQSKSVISEN